LKTSGISIVTRARFDIDTENPEDLKNENVKKEKSAATKRVNCSRLVKAAMFGQSAHVRRCIDKGCDLNSKNRFGETAFDVAASLRKT
jgi:hypothetical protein